MNRSSIDKLRAEKMELHAIIGEEDYLHTSIMIPLISIGEEYHFLFEKRNGMISQGNEICFPGGKVDTHNGESSLDAAIRETEEEIGIDRKKIIPVGFLGTLVANRLMTVKCHMGELMISGIEECSPNRNEVDILFTIPVSFFENNVPEKYAVEISINPSVMDENGREQILLPSRELGLPERYFSTWGNFRQPVYVYRTEFGTIWGITAQIISACVKKIRSTL